MMLDLAFFALGVIIGVLVYIAIKVSEISRKL